MKTCVVYVLLLAACSGCLQKHCVSMGASGVVVDSQTQLPLAGARVSVPAYTGKEKLVITGADGRFSIQTVVRRDFVIIMADFAPPASTLLVERHGYFSTNVSLVTAHTNFVIVPLAPGALQAR
jgi:hypothetical protein